MVPRLSLRVHSAALMIAVAVLATTMVHAEDDSLVAREREMLHRTQEALRQSQADNAELAKKEQDAEEKLKAANDQIAGAQRSEKSVQGSLQAQKTATAAAQQQIADLTRKLDDANRQLTVAAGTQHDTAAQLAQRDADLKHTQQDLAHSVATNSSCEAKNVELYRYSQALLDRYHKKGVWDALSQKEPVLGLKEVQIENTLQEYQQKLDAQKITPKPAS
jgi:chromosome segregation ATPase